MIAWFHTHMYRYMITWLHTHARIFVSAFLSRNLVFFMAPFSCTSGLPLYMLDIMSCVRFWIYWQFTKEMGYKDKFLNGEVPESGAIFMANIRTKKECLRLKLFGLPSGMSDFVLHVKKGMTLFLFEFERRLLYGVFRATSDGEINIEPKAFRSSGKHFPAQVWISIWPKLMILMFDSIICISRRITC